MNSNTLDKTKDPGKDGTVYPSGVFANRNERVAKDVVGFSLGYYGGDYSPIGGNPAEAAYAGTAFGNGADDLFNGNIRHTVTAIEGLDIQGYAYRYDQLQRIKEMQVYRAGDVQSLFAWTNSASTDEYKTTFTYDRNGNIDSLNRNGIGSELDMDRFVYNYHTTGGERSNRLDYVIDNGTNYTSYEDIKSGQATGNYTYNKIGELIEDASEDMILHWRTGDHKLSKIERNDQDSPQIEFHYNPFGQRTMKVEKSRTSGVIDPASEWKYTYYSYDVNGQVMAVYSGNFQGSSDQVKLAEQHLYGSERLGVINRNVVVFDNGVTSYTHKEEDVVHEDERGHKRYELHGHTNSVLAVISDRKMYNSVDGNYEPVMTSWADYYLFGMLQSGRHGSATSELYRYQFQSMETDRGISGEGNSYTTEFRQYDPRLGRWKSLDPLMAKYPMMSPYVAFNNNPVFFTDPLGLEGVSKGKDKPRIDSSPSEGSAKKDGFFKRMWNALSGNKHVNRANDFADKHNGKVVDLLEGEIKAVVFNEDNNTGQAEVMVFASKSLRKQNFVQREFEGDNGISEIDVQFLSPEEFLYDIMIMDMDIMENGNTLFSGSIYEDVEGYPSIAKITLTRHLVIQQARFRMKLKVGGKADNFNAIYIRLKKNKLGEILPYVGKSINSLKRYVNTDELRGTLRNALSGITDKKLIRAVERRVYEYLKTKGPVSNVRKPMNDKDYLKYKEQVDELLKGTNWEKAIDAILETFKY